MALRDRTASVSLLLLLVSGTVSAVLAGYAALVLWSGLVEGALVAAVLRLAFPVLPLFVLAAVAAVLSAVGLVYGLARKARLPRGGRVEAVARRAEREYPVLRTLGVGDALSEPEPTPEERRADALDELKRRYVAGDVDEAEFERKLDRLVANDTVDDARAERERRVAETERRERS
ncbi:SHOCT domain-containing protein [Halogeometricum luteum]|uniref:SHOCT domain-containing protein n=1 Tax=Halogeometricum luteum TaxID=2950537 RepID=UPI00287B7AA2|nr:SHOCT domain-containing protein [Halogeometricum sp. S3BR5-2]